MVKVWVDRCGDGGVDIVVVPIVDCGPLLEERVIGVSTV